MQLHADLSERVVVDSGSLAWVPSPCPGIDRRLLERDGAELARATSVVRYQPGAAFTGHAHAQGEEIFVLEGELCDEHGRYPAGTWLKNPPGSTHTPYAEQGCVLLVKLRQLAAEDRIREVVDSHTGTWTPGRAPGVDGLRLGAFGGCQTGLVRFAPGARSTRHLHAGGEEIFVLSGSYSDEHGYYGQGTWIRSPDGSGHLPFSEEGCLLFIKTGHLPMRSLSGD